MSLLKRFMVALIVVLIPVHVLAQALVVPTGSGTVSGTNTGDVTLGAVGSTANANGASLAGQVLTLQPASAAFPGLMTTGTQTLAGAKTWSNAALFSSTISASNLSGTNTGDITLATVGSSPANAGASLSGQVLTLQPADATHGGALSTTTQTIAGAKTWSGAAAFSSTLDVTGLLTSAVSSGSNALLLATGARLKLGGGTTDYFTSNGSTTITAAGNLAATGTLAGSNLSGTNTGDITLGSVGSSPATEGASLSGQVLTLQPADATHGGVLSTGTQTIAGAKTWSGAATFSSTVGASNLSGTNTGDITLGAVGASANANGASLSSQVLTLQPASASFPGVMTTGTQTVAGAKTWSGAAVFSSTSDFQGNLSNSTGTLTLGDAVAVTSTLDLQGVVSNSAGNLTLTDVVDITGATGVTGALTVTGNILTGTHNTYDLGVTGTRFKDGYFQGTVTAANGFNAGSATVTATNYISNAGNTTLSLRGTATDGASALAIKLGNNATLSTAGAKMVSFQNNGTEKAFVDLNGSIAMVTSPTLQTCASALEGLMTRGAGGTSGARTKICLCTSDGAGSPAYAWKNISDIFALDASSVGTTTTCP